MGIRVNIQKAGSRSRSRHRPMGDINVTPMVDVMLVLLIVFMVTAPLLTVGVPVDLPVGVQGGRPEYLWIVTGAS